MKALPSAVSEAAAPGTAADKRSIEESETYGSWWVLHPASIPRTRRRGFGAAATWEVVRRGREQGAEVTALVSSPMGEPVYLAMGLEVVGHVRTLVRS